MDNLTEIEQWKPVIGHEGLYEVSGLGRVRRKGSGKVMNLTPDKKGYRRVTLCKEGKHSKRLVHRLVAEAFVPNPDNLPQVNHRKAIKRGGTNAASNLEWATHKGNMDHAATNGLMASGEGHHRAKLNRKLVEEIRSRYGSGRVYQRELAGEFAVAQATIWRALRGRSWRANG